MASNTKVSATCGNCSETYKDPRMLTCLHSFCKKCLIKIFEESTKSTLTCPLCSEASPVPTQGVEYLPKDYRKAYEVEIAEYEGLIKGDSSVSCDHCVKGQAIFFAVSVVSSYVRSVPTIINPGERLTIMSWSAVLRKEARRVFLRKYLTDHCIVSIIPPRLWIITVTTAVLLFVFVVSLRSILITNEKSWHLFMKKKQQSYFLASTKPNPLKIHWKIQFLKWKKWFNVYRWIKKKLIIKLKKSSCSLNTN